MSRGRPSLPKTSSSSMVDNEQVMTQVWHGVVDTLRQLPSVPSAPGGPSAEAESQIVAAALDKLGVLMALRKGQPVSADALPSVSIPRLDISTPTPAPSAGGTPGPGSGAGAAAGAGGGGGVKRKRRMSTHSPAPPPLSASLDSALSSLASPLPVPSSALEKRGHTPVSMAASASAAGSIRGGTPMSREATGKIRKELYSDQLPLQPGRRVAFKVPAGKREEDGDESWILAMIRKCIQMDKMRYEVQDADEATSTFNTTLRSIIPLPDPHAPITHPSHPLNAEVYPANTQVLAMYPDTTAFYRATVIMPPGTGTGAHTGKKDKKAGSRSEDKYRLKFVDDGEIEHDVDRSCVVLHPA